MITSQDVAKLAKVSQATVSRAFREDVYINPETKKKVMAAAKTLGYFPNYNARSLKNKKSGIIGLVLADADNMFYSALTKSIERYVSARGYRLFLAYTNEDPAKEREYLESFISSQVEGLLCMPVSLENQDLYDIMKANQISVLQVIRKLYSDFDTVTVNDEMGAYIATKYMLERGHRNILMTEYGFNEKVPVKTAGYRRAYEEMGIPFKQNLILDLPFGIDVTGLVAGAIAENNATAIISSNQLITLATLRATKRQKLHIPEDISLIAYDDSDWLEFLDITAITHPMEEIGKNMAKVLFESIEAKSTGITDEEAKFVEVKPYLLLRNSIKNLTDPNKNK